VAQAGDWERNLLQSILAVIAPAESYRSHPGDIPALMAARIWEGSEVAQPPYRVTEQSRDRGITRYETQWTWESASVGALVWQFAGKKPRPASHLPLCAASNQPFRMASAGSGFPVVPTPADRGTPSAIPPAGGSGRTAMFKGGVTYVTVPVSVVDGEGKILTDLNLSSFRVFEDDQLQSVDRLERPGAAVSVTLLVDSSSSMRRRYDETRDAIKAAVTAFKDVGTMSMVSFDRRIVLYTTPPADLFRRQPGPNEPSPSVGRSATRFYDAIDLVLTGPLNTTSGRTALVILTDGVDTASRLATAEGARRRLGESHTPAYVIQYDTQQDAVLIGQGRGMNLIVNGTIPELTRRLVPENAADPGPAYARAAEFLRDIADVSGGRRYAAQGGADLPRTLNEIATELGQQYLLAYYPTNQARDGTYRRIRVEVDRPGANVRARAGYLQVPPSLGGR
jgi:Ca-activated chloride channel family protein